MPQAEARPAVLDLFRSTGAYLSGHFRLTSGLHSPAYLQCALVLQHPRIAEDLGRRLAQAITALVQPEPVDVVASPAIGGLIIGHEVARALGAKFIFAERDTSGKMTLRRGFRVEPDEHVLVVEDVWTTGRSTQETIQVVEEAGGRVVAAGALIDRSGGKIEFPVEACALLDLPIASYEADECPLCRDGSAAVKPGSRYVRSAS